MHCCASVWDNVSQCWYSNGVSILSGRDVSPSWKTFSRPAEWASRSAEIVCSILRSTSRTLGIQTVVFHGGTCNACSFIITLTMGFMTSSTPQRSTMKSSPRIWNNEQLIDHMLHKQCQIRTLHKSHVIHIHFGKKIFRLPNSKHHYWYFGLLWQTFHDTI